MACRVAFVLSTQTPEKFLDEVEVRAAALLLLMMITRRRMTMMMVVAVIVVVAVQVALQGQMNRNIGGQVLMLGGNLRLEGCE